MSKFRTGRSYDDVLIVPQRSPVESRSNVDLTTRITEQLTLDRPLISAPMDTVTESELAIALGNAGGMGVIHRFLTPDEQATEVAAAAEAGVPVGAAVGIDEDVLTRTEAVLTAGADCLVVDVAHGHLERCLDTVKQLSAEFPDVDLIAGNVATPSGVRDLAAAGADCVKVGIGPGSHCTTREVAGVGVPQFTAVRDCAQTARDIGTRIIADGGIRTSGDAVKALAGGAAAVMLGGRFAGTAEAPTEVVERNGTRYKRSRGMATAAANNDRSDKDQAVSVEEGTEALTPYKGPAGDIADSLAAGIRSGCSYTGAHTIDELQDNAEFIEVTPDANARAGGHGSHNFEPANDD